MKINQFRLFNNQVMPENIYMSTNYQNKREKKRRHVKYCLLSLLVLLIIGTIITAIVVPILVLRKETTTASTTIPALDTSIMTTMIITTTKLTTLVKSSTAVITQPGTLTKSTSTIICLYPFALSPSGQCVNILIDFNNCGTVGYICPSNYTSCSAGVCSVAPDIQLNNPIPIFTAAVNGSVDDQFYSVTIPFNITLYNTTTDVVEVTTNGVLCLGICSTNFTPSALPSLAFPETTALPYWSDLYIYANTSQGIYYQSEGNAPNRTLIFEYYCSHYFRKTDYYHFQVLFFENMPGIVRYIYYDISDRGNSSTIGVQGTGLFIQHSFKQSDSVRPNMTLTFDTNKGTYTHSTIT